MSYVFFDLLACGGCQSKGEQPPQASRNKAKKKAVNHSQPLATFYKE